ncbi:MAG: ATP-binding protein [Deltaproteobacteria bacterium]|nr:ATP-binding protein [Deltaproteobacteria bacterium]
MRHDPTHLGTVEDVKGSTVSVVLHEDTLSGLAFVEGHAYRIGQGGSFVRIPIGYVDLFGIVSQVGASAVPDRLVEYETHGHRWMTVQLVGEGTRKGDFERGLSQYPTIGDAVHLVTEDDLKRIYGRPDSPQYIRVGSLASSESIAALIDINKLVTRHSAVIGSTGTGKSTTVAGLLNTICRTGRFESARVIVLDIHGEYAAALQDEATIFKINPDKRKKELPLYVPYWALTFDELLSVTFGDVPSDADRGGIIEKVTEKKLASLKKQSRRGVTESTLNVDTPIPFSIHQLWYELHLLVISTHLQTGNQSVSTVAFETDSNGNDIDHGDAMKVRPPKCKPQDTSAGASPKVYLSQSRLNIRRPLEALAYKLRDSRYDFLFRPGDWLPDANGIPKKDLDDLLNQWLECTNPVTILDLSGIPRDILNTLIGVLLRIIYDSIFWARNLSEGGRERPLLLVLEEAHAYLGKEDVGPAAQAVRRIVKEGRKYGIGAMIISQRPVEIDTTILSQCGTFFAMRLANSQDRSHVTSVVSENLEGLFSMLPILRTGEAIIVGEAVHIPVRTMIDPPSRNRRPDSQDPVVYEENNPGGWNRSREPSNYAEVVELWRKQDPIPTRIVDFDKKK